MPKLYWNSITVQRVEIQFFCDIFVAFYIKLECLKHYDAKNTPNLTIIKF